MPERFHRGASPSGGITHRKPIRDPGTGYIANSPRHWAICPRWFCFRTAIGPADGTLECPKHGPVSGLGDANVRTPLEAT